MCTREHQRTAGGSLLSFTVWVLGTDLGSSGLGASTLPAEPCGQLYKDILFFLRKKILAPPNQVHQGGFWPRTDIYQGWGSRGPSLETEHWLWPSWNTKEPSVGARPGCPGVNACLTAFLNGAYYGSWVAGIQQQVHSIGSGVEGGLRCLLCPDWEVGFFLKVGNASLPRGG